MKKILASLFLICLAVFQIQAKYVARPVLESTTTEAALKSMLVMDQAWVPYPAYADRAGWEALLGKDRGTIIAQGENYLDFEWIAVKAEYYLAYARNGNRTLMQNALGRNTTALSCLMMAELAEGKGRFMDDIVNGILYFCETTSWAISAHLSSFQKDHSPFPDWRDNILELTQGGISQMMCWIYYFFNKEFDKIYDGISPRLRYEIQRRELTPYLERTDFWWMGFNDNPSVNNWGPWCNSNAILCFMLMENDRDTLAKAVWKTMRSVDTYFGSVQEDGACDEGPSYWYEAAGKLFDYLCGLDMITGGKINLWDNKVVRDMGEYIVNATIGNGWVVNFADATAKANPGTTLIWRYGKAVDSKLMQDFAVVNNNIHPAGVSTSWTDFHRAVEALKAKNEMEGKTATLTPSEFTWYPQTQFCFMRGGRAFLAAKGGHNGESHNHNDVGTFIYTVDNTPLLIDAGVGTYTKFTFSDKRYDIWSMQSNYHNLPVINGVAQRQGSSFFGTGTTADKAKKTFSTDIATAYPKEAAVNSWIRGYRLDNAGKLEISDKFSLKETKEPSVLHFMTWGDVVMGNGRVSIEANGKKAVLTYDPKAFKASIETINLDDPRFTNVWGDKIYRLDFTAKASKAKGSYKFTVTPAN